MDGLSPLAKQMSRRLATIHAYVIELRCGGCNAWQECKSLPHQASAVLARSVLSFPRSSVGTIKTKIDPCGPISTFGVI